MNSGNQVCVRNVSYAYSILRKISTYSTFLVYAYPRAMICILYSQNMMQTRISKQVVGRLSQVKEAQDTEVQSIKRLQLSLLLKCDQYSFYRAMRCKRSLCCHAVSVCPPVCPSRSWITSKRINISSIFFHRRVATPF